MDIPGVLGNKIACGWCSYAEDGNTSAGLPRDWSLIGGKLICPNCQKKLTFGDLEQGDRFIFFPIPGDNAGHGGYLGKQHIFVKLSDEYQQKGTDNARRECDGVWSHFPDGVEVLKVG